MKVFLDTNVLASAFATRGLCADLFRYILAEHELIIGEVVLAELRRVLEHRIHLPKSTITEIENLLREYTVVPKPNTPIKLEIKDVDDQWVMASAIEGKADIFVTGDQELLTIKNPPIKIKSPRQFWELARNKS